MYHIFVCILFLQLYYVLVSNFKFFQEINNILLIINSYYDREIILRNYVDAFRQKCDSIFFE